MTLAHTALFYFNISPYVTYRQILYSDVDLTAPDTDTGRPTAAQQRTGSGDMMANGSGDGVRLESMSATGVFVPSYC